MANKRTASTDLNHDNWDDDEEPETSGKFQPAESSVIATRVIKRAKRRLNNAGTSDASMEAPPQRAPRETIFHTGGISFANNLHRETTTFYTSRSNPHRLVPLLSSGDLNATQSSASHAETKITENKGSTEDNDSTTSDEESPRTSAFRPVNPANSPSTSWAGLTAAHGSKSKRDPTSVEKPVVSSDKNSTWHHQSQGGETPVAKTKSCLAPKDAEIPVLSETDSRFLLKPIPDNVLARLKAKAVASSKSLNFLKRIYQLNMTTLDWLHILVSESLTVNIAEVMPSYMREVSQLIDEEITNEKSDEKKGQLLLQKKKLQQMVNIFKQFGYLDEDENSKSETLPESSRNASTSNSPGVTNKSPKSEMLPESSKNTSTSNSPRITNKSANSPQSSSSHVTRKDNPWKMKDENQEAQEKVQDDPPDASKDSEQTETDDESSNTDSSYTPVVEEGAVCTMRCKVFVKKILDPSDPFDTPYQNRGIGSLFIKPISKGKLQLVVRADNSLGNIILNTCITPDIPIEIANSNTLMLVCSPMPGDIARTVLIRVKDKLHVDLLHVNLIPA